MRIIAGKWRGRVLRAPKGRAVRPTADRVRESIFGILGNRVEGVAVLDLFAGTGALGLEALSRGALSAVLVEADPVACEVIRKNVESLSAGGAEILRMDYRRALRRLQSRGRRFGLLFLDPPYRAGIARAAALALSASGVTEPGAIAVVEEAARSPRAEMPPAWTLWVERLYGDTRVSLYEVAA
ncbi:MAG: 16S rRNA (guanine(966)-N(2))-methyltransferase RsmD [Deltaproteobacteria bacterium]